MRHWVSIKLASDTARPMSAAPLVIHPDDAAQVLRSAEARAVLTFESQPYKGSSTIYDGTPGRALSLPDERAVDAFVAAVTEPVACPTVCPAAGAASSPEAVLLAAAAQELDTEPGAHDLAATTRQALIEARIGQGQFRQNMLRLWEHRCAVTGCAIEAVLVASHAVAWKDNADPAVRLDPYNGLLLAASIDRLFDRGLISFADDGALLRQPGLSASELALLGLQPDARLRAVHERHKTYLRAHRARHGF
ncbi:HNH endonuclease [Sphaerotilus natans]|nr:HNH endonuclease [Sphaerotilus natans]